MLIRLLFLVLLLPFLIGCSSLASLSKGSSCAGCQNVREIQDTYKANPIRAESQYVGQRVRIGGKAESIDGKGIYAYINLKNSSEIRLVAWGTTQLFQHPEKHRIWQEWVASHDVGDVVEAECVVNSVFKSNFSRGPAMVSTKDCVPLEFSKPDQETDEREHSDE